jgi:hypothetical protein
MPKLDGTHLPQRLAQRLADLRADKEVAARDIRVLLSKDQQAAMDTAWVEQQLLRKGKRARTKEEELALGWKSKRDIHIEAYEKALAEAEGAVLDELHRLQLEASKRQMQIYMTTMKSALAEGKERYVAKNLANNDLTRAGLRRMDGQIVGHQSPRDREVWEMESQILQTAKNDRTPENLEPTPLLEEQEKAAREKMRKRGS